MILYRPKTNKNGYYYGLIANHEEKSYKAGNSYTWNFKKYADYEIIVSKTDLAALEIEFHEAGYNEE